MIDALDESISCFLIRVDPWVPALAFKGLNILNFKGLHALAFRRLRVLTFSGLYSHTLREFKVLCP